MNDVVNRSSVEWREAAARDARFEQRRMCRIPDELHNRDILYASAHVGVLPEAFAGDIQDQRYAPLEGFIDAKAVTPAALIDFIAGPCRKLVETKPGEPDWIVNFIYLEPLDQNGKILDVSTTIAGVTIAFSHTTYQVMLAEMAELLRQKGILQKTEHLSYVGSAACQEQLTVEQI